MFGIELSLMQKLEIALVLVVLGIAGVFVFKSMQPERDMSIDANSYVKQHPVAEDPRRPAQVTATNPADPKKDENILQISMADGRFSIIRYPNDPSRYLALEWDPDTHHPGQKYDYYKDPMSGVDEYSDPFKKGLAFATYKMVYEVPAGLGLLRSASMDKDQLAKESEARAVMNAEIALKKSGIEDGTFQPNLLEKVLQALKTYDATPGTPLKNKPKADAARRVLEAATDYLNANLAEQEKAIDKYISVMDSVLKKDQKEKFIAGYEQYIQQTTPAARRGITGGVAPSGRTGTIR